MDTATDPIRLYLVKREGRTGYDEPASYVVAALSQAGARLVAVETAARWDFGDTERELTGPIARSFQAGEITYLGVAAPAIERGIVLTDFRHG